MTTRQIEITTRQVDALYDFMKACLPDYLKNHEDLTVMTITSLVHVMDQLATIKDKQIYTNEMFVS